MNTAAITPLYTGKPRHWHIVREPRQPGECRACDLERSQAVIPTQHGGLDTSAEIVALNHETQN